MLLSPGVVRILLELYCAEKGRMEWVASGQESTNCCCEFEDLAMN
jgi:hypothetical protein